MNAFGLISTVCLKMNSSLSVELNRVMESDGQLRVLFSVAFWSLRWQTGMAKAGNTDDSFGWRSVLLI